ncbi:serpin-Z1 [Lolium perenne]|uniref:serpin-Z1 n=1 Tax=Lolium perenne TaxID=4522 RepID=UPI0021EA1D2D|nr:serpin-Z1-like [Lolium perenne]
MAEQQLADAMKDQAAFSMRLLRGLGLRGDQNVAFSPVSFHAVLSLLAAGATGAIRDQIVSFLGPAGAEAHAALMSSFGQALRPSCEEGRRSPKIRCATGVWVDSSLRLKPAFAAMAASRFNAEARAVSFGSSPEQARSEINEWFEGSTGGQWKELLPEGSISGATMVVLANALYFRGYWYDPFDPTLTEDGDFYVSPGHTVRTPFMAGNYLHEYMCIACHPGFKALRMIYAGSHHDRLLSMCIYLPDDRDGLPELVHALSSDPAALLAVPTKRVPVGKLRIPKFEVSLRLEASQLLRDLGLDLPFRLNPAGQSFSEMLEDSKTPMAVSSVIHHCSVSVNEEGTVATADTNMEIIGFGPPSDEVIVDFVADHPFLFFIIREEGDNTSAIVYAGQVVNPLLD